VGISLLGLSGGLLAPTAANAAAAEQSLTSAGWQSHPTAGCGAGTLVYTPGNADISAATAGLNAAARQLTQRAAASHATWLSTLACAPGSAQATTYTAGRSPAVRPEQDITDVSYNWSGYETNDVNGVPAVSAAAEWTVPAVTGIPPGGYSAYSSIWPGIGGDNDNSSGELIQDGTEQDTSCGFFGCHPDYFAWFEMVPDPQHPHEQVIRNFPVVPGDDISAEVDYDAASGNATFEMCNFTRNNCTAFTAKSPEVPGGSAEWIVERTQRPRNLPLLAKFHQVTLLNDFTSDGSSLIALDQVDSYPVEMQNCKQTQTLAEPDATPTGSRFGVHWEHWGPTHPLDPICGR
jgi:hypothetical protein